MNDAREYGERLNAAMIKVIEEARWEKKLRSARALAEAAGMTHTYLNQRLNGSVAFNVRDLGALGEALGIPAGELMSRVSAAVDLSDLPDTLVAKRSQEAAGAAEDEG